MELWVSWFVLAALSLTTLALVWLAFRFTFARLWLRVTVRMVSGLAALPFALASLIWLYGLGCESHTVLIGSPDHTHVARVLVNAGWNEPDFGFVVLRRSWSPSWHNVFEGDGFIGKSGEPIEPQVRWIDNSHLLIEPNHVDGGEVRLCRDKVDDVSIICSMR